MSPDLKLLSVKTLMKKSLYVFILVLIGIIPLQGVADTISGDESSGDESSGDESSGDESSGDESATSTDLLFVYGNNVWVSGWRFNNSKDWLGLNCTEEHCQLEPAELFVSIASWQGHYDDRATSGQKLTFKKSSNSPGKVLAWIRINKRLPWLLSGNVEHYYAHTLNPIVQDKPDTYEIMIRTSKAEYEYLTPVLLRPSDSAMQDNNRKMMPDYYQHGESIYLQLRSRGKRQLLSEQLSACYGELGLGYLQWAGDLDQDGETDYLIDYVDGATGSVKLYLSSYADGDELAGLAGSGFTHPLDGECA